MPRGALILCLAAGMVCAQDAKRCTIAGTVTDERSGAPIPNATLILSPVTGGQPRVFDSASDATGKFSLKDLAARDYLVTATAEGHSQRTVLTNCTGAVRSVKVELPWQGLISGRVTDRDGRGVPGAHVALMRPGFHAGNRRFFMFDTSIANSDGQFSLDNLPLGTYYLSATLPDGAKNIGEQVYVTTFYPSAIESYAAAPILIRGPGEIGGTDIRLLKARAFSVRGRLLTADVSENVRAYTIRLLPGDLRTPAPQCMIRDDQGRFEFSGLIPGTYTLVAFTQVGPMARLKVEVGDSDLNDVELMLSGGQNITGVLTLDDKEQNAAPEAAIYLQSWENLPISFDTKVKGNHFLFSAIPAAIYQVRIQLPRQNYARALRVDGRDVPDWIADLTTPQPHTIEIVLGSDAGRLTGYARDGSGNPRPKTVMTLVPAGNGPLTTPQYAFTYSDAQGRYVFAGVQPGAYKVFAWEKVDPGLVQNRQVLSQFETQCADVEVPPQGTANSDVTVITASATAALE